MTVQLEPISPRGNAHLAVRVRRTSTYASLDLSLAALGVTVPQRRLPRRVANARRGRFEDAGTPGAHGPTTPLPPRSLSGRISAAVVVHNDHTRPTHRVHSCGAAATVCCSRRPAMHGSASRTDALNDECCDEATEDCSSGRPATCNIGCARVLLPFFDDCRTALAVDTVAEFDDIVALCQRTMEIEDPLPVQCFIRGDDVAYETFVCSPDSPAWSTDGFTVRSAHGVSAVPGCATSTWTENAAQSCPAPAGHAGDAGGSSGSGDESTCVAIMAESTDDVASDPKVVCPSGADIFRVENFDYNGLIVSIPRTVTCVGSIGGSFEWKVSYAVQQGCEPLGSPFVQHGSFSQAMFCPATMQHGDPPMIDSEDGQLAGQRAWGDCYIPQPKATGGHVEGHLIDGGLSVEKHLWKKWAVRLTRVGAETETVTGVTLLSLPLWLS